MNGGGNSAARAAQREEERRAAAIRQTQGAVNAAYTAPGRQADIARAVDAARIEGEGRINREKADTDRQLKFQLARGGQTGGSLNVDLGQRMGEEYSRVLLDNERRAQGVGSALETDDQNSRAQLIALATSGLDATNANQMAMQSMRSALEANRATSMVGSAGDVFGTFGKWLKESRDAYERRRANKETGFGFYG